MKKLLSFALALGILLPLRAFAADAPEISAEAAILYHPASDTVLRSKNAEEELPMASTTKLMTALTVIRLVSPDTETVIRPEWTAVEGSSMYLRAGEKYTVRELLTGLLLASGNDAALALAETAAESTEAFVAEMNAFASELSLAHTHFMNPHGLSEEGHYSCAADLARIMAEALREPLLRELLATRDVSIHNITYVNHNKLLWQCEGVNGGKTGYTKAAGRCLVTSCERDGMELICVTLHDPCDWEDHAALYDYAYGAFAERHFSASEPMAELSVVSGSVSSVPLRLGEDVSFCLPDDTPVEARLSVPDFVFAPLSAGERVGECWFYVNGECVKTTPLVSALAVSRVIRILPGGSVPAGRFIGSFLL